MRINKLWIILSISILFSVPGFSQIYKYTDEDGNIRFTDNVANLPESKRESVTIMREIKSSPEAEETSSSLPKETASAQSMDSDNQNHEIDQATIEKIRKAKASIDYERTEIEKLHENIEKDKTKLGNPPPQSASHAERRAYQEKAIELNSRIKKYQEKVKIYEQKVKLF